MSMASKVALGISVLLSAGTVAAVHIQQRRRLHEGVIRDLERQSRKLENIRLLQEQITLTKQLEAERDQMLMEKGSQQS
uniref:PET117 cytochrome c oxidase chaperone n=1 Tax=Chelonoidis abingdonii TaxID=106734 RepID=A0A8C0GLH3_CHEAB